jgi:hypothetical protein
MLAAASPRRAQFCEMRAYASKLRRRTRTSGFGPAARDPLKNHIAACPPPPYHFCASVHYAWLSTQRLAGVVITKTNLTKPRPTKQNHSGHRPFAGSGQESRSLSRPPGGLARDDNVFGSSESATLRIKRERSGGNGKFLPPHSN